MSKIIGNITATPVPRSDWEQTDETKADYIRNKPTLSTVATTGNYDDLENKPEGLATETYVTKATTALKNDILNGAGEAYDTLKELGDLIDENTDALEALETVATGKADAGHKHTVSDITDLTATATELNYMDGVTSNVQTQMNNKLSLSGGTMTGEIKIGQGDGKGIQLGTNGRINATVGSNTAATMFGISNGIYYLGHSGFSTTIRGSQTRPTYNANDMALYSDVTSVSNELKNKMPNVAVSTSDNGKFLRVVDGVWTAVSVPSAEGVNF